MRHFSPRGVKFRLGEGNIPSPNDENRLSGILERTVHMRRRGLCRLCRRCREDRSKSGEECGPSSKGRVYRDLPSGKTVEEVCREMSHKLDACRSWRVRVIDCRCRPLDYTEDNHRPGPKTQAKGEYTIHEGRTLSTSGEKAEHRPPVAAVRRDVCSRV